MKWQEKSNPALVAAILASFRDTPENSRHALSQFTAREWSRTELWLDLSGLALHFIEHLRSNGLTDVIDQQILDRLEQKLADNKDRTADMFQEFVAINRIFEDADLRYANLKGFTLSPDSCPDPSLRHLSDFDFLIDPAHLNIGRTLLEKRGYVLTGTTSRTLEFRHGSPQKVGFEGRYKIQTARFVELHTAIESKASTGSTDCSEHLNRLATWACDAGSFPALSSADQLIGQALHLFGHLRSEHTRPSWLLEYRHHVMARRDDDSFWTEVKTLAARNPNAPIAFGLSTLLAREIFGSFTVPQLDSWTVDTLPPAVKSWADRYGRRSVLADVPGTKLYLLLDMALAQTRPSHQLQRRKSQLIPLRPPPRILRAPAKDTFVLRLHRELVQLRFILYRLRFHFKQGAIYALESRRWNRVLKADGHKLPHSTASECYDKRSPQI